MGRPPPPRETRGRTRAASRRAASGRAGGRAGWHQRGCAAVGSPRACSGVVRWSGVPSAPPRPSQRAGDPGSDATARPGLQTAPDLLVLPQVAIQFPLADLPDVLLPLLALRVDEALVDVRAQRVS